MTEAVLDALCAEYDGALVQPITVEDCATIYAALRPQIAAGVSLDVVIRGSRVDIVAGRLTRSIAVA